MNCTNIIERLGEHLDRMLPHAEAAEFDAHLATCGSCRAEMDDLRRTLDAVKALPRVRAPRGFAAGVMAEIRTEPAAATAGPARVTPIRSATVFMRLAASIAAVCLVWVGVRALQVDQAIPPATGVAAKNEPLKRTGEVDEIARLKKAGDARAAENASKTLDASLAAAKDAPEGRGYAPVADGISPPAPAVPQDAGGLPDTAARKGAAGDLEKAGWAAQPEEKAQGLAVQRITVYSSDIAVDTSQLKKLLSESGYTYSTQKKAILVRVPASEATRLVASLGSMPGGFRAADRQSLDALERLKKTDQKAGKSDKNGQPGGGEGGLTADADDLKEALRQHIDESRREIQKQEEGKKLNEKKAPASDPKVTAGGGGGLSGKSKNGASKEKDSAGAKAVDPAEGADEHDHEEAMGASSEPAKAPAGPVIAGGNRPEEAEKKEHGKDGGRGDDTYKDPGEPKPEAGGTDDVEGRVRREKELGEKLSDELRKLESERKLADAEDAVVIYIEFEEPAAK
ncbi:MAG: putative transmembrane anti-sigma [Planctomycetota bacterium]|nr:MAG: putative transmembrane anti-sigma [Planctomycetota bacterium]